MTFIAAKTEIGWVVLSKDSKPHVCSPEQRKAAIGHGYSDHDITGCGEREDRWHLGWKRGIELVTAKLAIEADSFGDQYLGRLEATADGAPFVDNERALDVLLLTLQVKENV